MIWRRAQSGFSYLEIIVALLVIVLSLPPALQAMRVGLDSAQVRANAIPLAERATATLESVLAEPFGTLRAAAAKAGNATVPTSYSDPAGTPDRRLVYLSYYDAGNGDADGNPFTILDPNADGDGNPYTGDTPHIGLLWMRVQIEGTAVAYETLTSE